MQQGISNFRLMGRNRGILVGGLILLLTLFAVSSTQASAAVPAPRWEIKTETNGILEPGSPFENQFPPFYLVTAINVGAGTTSGEYRVVDTLPAGLKVAENPFEVLVEPASLTCTVVEGPATEVICSGSQPLQTGKHVTLRIPVEVPSGASGVAVDQAQMEGGGSAAAAATVETPITKVLPTFEFLPQPRGSSFRSYDLDGLEAVQAGSHPGASISSVSFKWEPAAPLGGLVRVPDGGAKDIQVDLPKGMAFNPQATPVKCREVQLEAENCPAAAQVGSVDATVSLTGNVGFSASPIFNMEAPVGVPAEIGFQIVEQGVYPHIFGRVRSETDYGLSAEIASIPSKIGVIGAEVELWGVPTSSQHDAKRGYRCGTEISFGEECPLSPGERTGRAFISMPTSCGGSLTTVTNSDSWNNPGAIKSSVSNGPGMRGCSNLEFSPTISSRATTAVADSPSGLQFDLHVPQPLPPEDPEKPGAEEGLQTADLKDARVTLPEGLTVNASSANGLDACSSAQIGLITPVGQAQPIHFDESLGGCPSASKLGAVEVFTPLLAEPLQGSVFLAKPFDNPFESLLAIYLAVEDERTGIVAKLAGSVEADPTTGRLTVSFRENPELPIEDVKLSLFSGPKAPLKTPLVCGTATTTSDLTPWTTPEGADADPADSFSLQVPPNGGPCPSSEGAAPKEFTFSAGTEAPIAGAFSPFSLRISRTDGSQHLTGLETTLPGGLLGRLAGIPYCQQSEIAAAQAREALNKGRDEVSSPSCPKTSEVGTVQVGAGAGPTPYYVDGHVYLAGPYKGAPLSIVAIVPAIAGPFDLGTVVDRVALNVGEYDARIHAVADPLPTIRSGIPFDVRSIELKLSRPGFTINPTSCESKEIGGDLSTQAGQSIAVRNSFQVGGCSNLAFKPKIGLSLKGATARTGHPALKAVIKYPKGASSNIAAAQVSLPHSEFLDQGNIARACSKSVLAAHSCPAKSIYGHVRAWTPLLGAPLEGPVYLVGGYGYKLPALVAELNGQIRILLVGKVDTGKNHGIRNTFEAVPDASVEKFVLELKGGKKYGLLENSENLCRKTQEAHVNFTAQNGKRISLAPRIADKCRKGHK